MSVVSLNTSWRSLGLARRAAAPGGCSRSVSTRFACRRLKERCRPRRKCSFLCFANSQQRIEQPQKSKNKRGLVIRHPPFFFITTCVRFFKLIEALFRKERQLNHISLFVTRDLLHIETFDVASLPTLRDKYLNFIHFFKHCRGFRSWDGARHNHRLGGLLRKQFGSGGSGGLRRLVTSEPSAPVNEPRKIMVKLSPADHGSVCFVTNTGIVRLNVTLRRLTGQGAGAVFIPFQLTQRWEKDKTISLQVIKSNHWRLNNSLPENLHQRKNRVVSTRLFSFCYSIIWYVVTQRWDWSAYYTFKM